MTEQYHDRYSKATEELPEKNAFFCETCNKKYGKEEAEEKNQTCCGRSMKEHLEEGFGP